MSLADIEKLIDQYFEMNKGDKIAKYLEVLVISE